jgi:hypothetical protein
MNPWMQPFAPAGGQASQLLIGSGCFLILGCCQEAVVVLLLERTGTMILFANLLLCSFDIM